MSGPRLLCQRTVLRPDPVTGVIPFRGARESGRALCHHRQFDGETKHPTGKVAKSAASTVISEQTSAIRDRPTKRLPSLWRRKKKYRTPTATGKPKISSIDNKGPGTTPISWVTLSQIKSSPSCTTRQAPRLVNTKRSTFKGWFPAMLCHSLGPDSRWESPCRVSPCRLGHTLTAMSMRKSSCCCTHFQNDP